MSEPFIVSARKYRPATFETVVGQRSITDTLKNAISSEHLAQAFLFCGPRGVGKTTTARILARTINCENLGSDLVACGECDPCRTFNEGHSLNIYELDAASNNSVDDIRSLINQVQIAPQVGNKKVYIIDEVHMLSAAAFNAFLKTLEEPPSYAIFILATTEKHKILPTILSRCQVFDFRRIQVADIVTHLQEIAEKEGIEAEEQGLHVIAQKADGSLRDSLSIFDQLVSFSGKHLTYQDVVKNLNVLDHDHYFSITNSILQGDVAACLLELNDILQQGFDGHLFTTGLGAHFRDVLVGQDARTAELLEISADLRQRFQEQAMQCDRTILFDGLEKIAQCDVQYKSSKHPRLLVELLLIQLCKLSRSGIAQVVELNTSQRTASAPAVKAQPKPQVAKAIEPPTKAEKQTSEASPVVEEPQPEPVARKKRSGSVSIKAFTEKVEAEPVKVKADPPEEIDPLKSANPTEVPYKKVTQTDLFAEWKKFALAKKNLGMNSFHATLMYKEPELIDTHTIQFVILNEVQEKDLREHGSELLTQLRNALGDPNLELKVEKEEVGELRPRYTAKDRFTILAEKNPALNELKDQLDLDLS